MGTDLYLYKCISKKGNKVVIHFQSGQSGLPPKGNAVWTKAFWVTAILELESGAWDKDTRAACCPLSTHQAWKVKNGQISVMNCPQMDMGELKALIKPFGHTRVLAMSGKMMFACDDDDDEDAGSKPASAIAHFSSLESAVECKAALNGKSVKNSKGVEKVLNVEFENLREGKPDFINHYTFEHEIFAQFLENVEELNVEYDEDESRGYWDTAATYELTFTDEKWCEHLREGRDWAGR
eukprot:Selendium_serpulae@DN1044_c0_g1_i1.p1